MADDNPAPRPCGPQEPLQGIEMGFAQEWTREAAEDRAADEAKAKANKAINAAIRKAKATCPQKCGEAVNIKFTNPVIAKRVRSKPIKKRIRVRLWFLVSVEIEVSMWEAGYTAAWEVTYTCM
jgi:hypothetical protein